MKVFKFHIGFHKTATTHFQDTLLAMRNDLVNQGMYYEPLDETRQKLSALTPKGKKKMLYDLAPAKLKYLYLRKTNFYLPSHCEHLLLSEENVSGTPLQLLSERLYPQIESKLHFLDVLASQKLDVRVYASIRSFDKVMTGAYITMLRFNPKGAIAAKDYFLELFKHGYRPNWHDLLKRINGITARPFAFKIWTQEDYSKRSSDIIKAFIGDENIAVPTLSRPTSTMTPSYSAIEKIEQMAAKFDKKPANWRQVCDDVYQTFPANNKAEKYTLFSEQEASLLKRLYQEDLQRIDESFPNIFLLQ
ncbi:hypothetical protein QTP81_03690 [Alteromonas sp. ASW11-36]|uniref:Sulfotransferase family protein n=1 Tax=Alteromonas arenosi TaxID=3055817 RepID=A0ABT7SU68_9ALTE|nr:hypothetical protein [Alteromonas sp. ASW11-36]MDM7859710.1 hypothetical protein [Alteromonas sp. ASW11-36]